MNFFFNLRSNRLITFFYLLVLNLDHLWQKDIFSLEFDMLDVYNDVTANYQKRSLLMTTQTINQFNSLARPNLATGYRR